MTNLKRFMTLSAAVVFFTIATNAAARGYHTWQDVMDSRETVKIYVMDLANVSEDPDVSVVKATGAVKEMFGNRISPRFDVVGSPEKADIIFKGEVGEYIWMEKAPVTSVHSAGALLIDLATRDGKNYARKVIRYRIFDPHTDRTLLEETTQATIKRAGVPLEKSYELMYERAARMLAMDIFRRKTDSQDRRHRLRRRGL